MSLLYNVNYCVFCFVMPQQFLIAVCNHHLPAYVQAGEFNSLAFLYVLHKKEIY